MLTASDAFARARSAIFRIAIEPGSGRNWWWGTGFFVSQSYALTAFHNLPAAVRQARTGEVRAIGANGTSFVLDFAPMEGDEAFDLALLRARGVTVRSYLPLGALGGDVSDPERVRYWAGRSVIVCGFPTNHLGQEEEVIAGHVRGDAPLGIQDEKDEGGVIAQVERMRIVPDQSTQLPGISGGPVVDLEHGLAIAVEGACDPGRRLILASEIRRHAPVWPNDLQRTFVQINGHQYRSILKVRRPVPLAAAMIALLVGALAASWLAARPMMDEPSPDESPSSTQDEASSQTQLALDTLKPHPEAGANQEPVPALQDLAPPMSTPNAGVPYSDQTHATGLKSDLATESAQPLARESSSDQQPVMATPPTLKRVPSGTSLRVVFPAGGMRIRAGDVIRASLSEDLSALDGSIAFPADAPVQIAVRSVRRTAAQVASLELAAVSVAGIEISTGIETVVGGFDIDSGVLNLETKTFKLASSLMLD